MTRDELESALLKAHMCDDKASLVKLYTVAADQAELLNDIDAACFYLTHAFVFALETGHINSLSLNERLVKHGRAEPIAFI